MVLKPCKRNDFGNSAAQAFKWPQCLSGNKDPPGWQTYTGPHGGTADPKAAKEMLMKKEAGKINPCTGKKVGGHSAKKGGKRKKDGKHKKGDKPKKGDKSKKKNCRKKKDCKKKG